MKYRLEIKPENIELTKWGWQIYEPSSDGKRWDYIYAASGIEKSHLRAQLEGRKQLAIFQAYDADEKLLKQISSDLTTIVEV